VVLVAVVILRTVRLTLTIRRVVAVRFTIAFALLVIRASRVTLGAVAVRGVALATLLSFTAKRGFFVVIARDKITARLRGRFEEVEIVIELTSECLHLF